MHTALLQTAWCNFSRNTSYFAWICSLQTHMPQRKINYSYSEGYVCFEYCICWQAWGCCNYVETIKSSSIFCRNCVLLKGHCSSIYLYKVKWTPGHFFKQYMLSSGHEHSFICSLSFNVITVLKQHIKQCTPTASCSLFFLVLRVNDVISCIFFSSHQSIESLWFPRLRSNKAPSRSVRVTAPAWLASWTRTGDVRLTAPGQWFNVFTKFTNIKVRLNMLELEYDCSKMYFFSTFGGRVMTMMKKSPGDAKCDSSKMC